MCARPPKNGGASALELMPPTTEDVHGEGGCLMGFSLLSQVFSNKACALLRPVRIRHGSNRGSAPSIERALIRVQPQKTGSDARGVRWPRGVGLPRQLATSSKAARHYSANSCDTQKSSIATVSPHLRARDFRLAAVFVSRPLCWLRPTLPANSATRKRRLLNHAADSLTSNPQRETAPHLLIEGLFCVSSSGRQDGY